MGARAMEEGFSILIGVVVLGKGKKPLSTANQWGRVREINVFNIL